VPTVSLSVPGAHCGTCRADILRWVEPHPPRTHEEHTVTHTTALLA
jgi:ferredoxin